MRSLALAFVALIAFSQQLLAQTAERPDHHHQIAACLAWRERVLNAVRHNNGTGLLPVDDAAAVHELVEMIGRRCDGDDPRRMSQLFAIVLDTLNDQRHQP